MPAACARVFSPSPGRLEHHIRCRFAPIGPVALKPVMASRYAAMSEDRRMAMSIAADSDTHEGTEAEQEDESRRRAKSRLCNHRFRHPKNEVHCQLRTPNFLTQNTEFRTQRYPSHIALHAPPAVARTVPNICNAFPSRSRIILPVHTNQWTLPSVYRTRCSNLTSAPLRLHRVAHREHNSLPILPVDERQPFVCVRVPQPGADKLRNVSTSGDQKI